MGEHYTYSLDLDYPTMLEEHEIMDPYPALRQLLADGKRDIRKEAKHFFFNILTPHRWMYRGDPLSIYSAGKRLMKMTDILWMIAASRRVKKNNSFEGYFSPGTLNPIPGSASIDFVFRKRNDRDYQKLLHKINDDPSGFNAAIFSGPVTNLKRQLSFLTKAGLSSTYQGRFSFYDPSANDVYFIEDYHSVEALINLACMINEKERKLTPDQQHQLSPYKIYSRSHDHLTRLYDDDIDDPFRTIREIFKYTVHADKTQRALKVWFRLLHQKNYWRSHNDPGNLLCFQEFIEKIIDIAWLVKEESGDQTAPDGSGTHEKQSSGLTTAARSFIALFFEYKRLHQWKKYLDTWTCCCLSNLNDHIPARPEEALKLISELIMLLHSLAGISVQKNSKSN